jgi:carbon storage regulator
MLILTRKTGEEITIGEHVTVRVVAVQEGQVKLGIEAPKELKIYRGEIYELIQQQNIRAAQISKTSVAKAAGLLTAEKRKSAESDRKTD